MAASLPAPAAALLISPTPKPRQAVAGFPLPAFGGSGQGGAGGSGQRSTHFDLRGFMTRGLLRAALTSGVLYGLGDILGQLVVEPYADSLRARSAPQGAEPPAERSYSLRRTLNFAACGFLFHGPYFSRIYGLLDMRWPHPPAGASVLSRLGMGFKKSLATNIFFGPPFLLGFLALVSRLDGMSWPEIRAKIGRLGPTLFLDGLKAWPVASALNFAFTPPAYRLAVVNVLGVGWNSWVSVRNAAASMDGEEEMREATALGAEMLAAGHIEHAVHAGGQEAKGKR
ncbi:hypothetical protein DFJ74DRAFT_711536 [Hyaloraphidium curvatum]|nr:hypothetical protein DFJ74DRAFT_711536 [Hyaloraphidium curvatum]